MKPVIVLDTGALIAVEAHHPSMTALIDEAAGGQLRFVIPTTVVAQAWRGGPRSARLARLLRSRNVTIAELNLVAARQVGELLAASEAADITDAHVARLALYLTAKVVTSDRGDLERLGIKPGQIDTV